MNGTVSLRIRMHEAWDDINLAMPADTSIAEVKRQVLSLAGEGAPADAFTVKFRGVELRNEQRSLRDSGIPDDAALIVLRKRRRAVR